MLLFNVIPDWRRSFVFLNALIEVSARIPEIVCIAQTTLVVVNNALLGDRRLLFFWSDLVSEFRLVYTGGISTPILRPSSPNCYYKCDLVKNDLLKLNLRLTPSTPDVTETKLIWPVHVGTDGSTHLRGLSGLNRSRGVARIFRMRWVGESHCAKVRVLTRLSCCPPHLF